MLQAVHNQRALTQLLTPSSPRQQILLFAAAFFAALAAGFYHKSPSSSYVLGGLSTALLALIVIDNLKTACPEDVQLCWEDIAPMTRQEYSFGLRHVDSKEEAIREQKSGFFGDALNLDFTASGTWNIYKPEDMPDEKGWRALDRLVLFGGSEEEKNALVKFCEAGIDNFIRGYQTHSNSAFMLINYGPSGHYSYDNHKYGNGLGKAGKQHVDSNQVMAIIPPPSLQLRDEALYRYYHNAIILALRTCVKTS